jgi:hypothetical protein
MSEKRSLVFWVDMSFATAGMITVILLIAHVDLWRRCHCNGAHNTMALILLVLVVGSLPTSSLRAKIYSWKKIVGDCI